MLELGAVKVVVPKLMGLASSVVQGVGYGVGVKIGEKMVENAPEIVSRYTLKPKKTDFEKFKRDFKEECKKIGGKWAEVDLGDGYKILRCEVGTLPR